MHPKAKEKFDLIYQIEKPRDSTILAVVLETVTYYPENDFSYYIMRTYQNDEFDTPLIIKPDDQVYSECTREFMIRVIKYWENGNKKYWKSYLFPKDTIKSVSDSLFYVKWPEDTLRATRVDY